LKRNGAARDREHAGEHNAPGGGLQQVLPCGESKKRGADAERRHRRQRTETEGEHRRHASPHRSAADGQGDKGIDQAAGKQPGDHSGRQRCNCSARAQQRTEQARAGAGQRSGLDSSRSREQARRYKTLPKQQQSGDDGKPGLKVHEWCSKDESASAVSGDRAECDVSEESTPAVNQLSRQV
jgi:hypothetical protein